MTETKQRSDELDPRHRKATEYDDGVQAYAMGMGVDSCPFYSGDPRTAWLAGWYDARTYDRMNHIFQRWRLTWP